MDRKIVMRTARDVVAFAGVTAFAAACGGDGEHKTLTPPNTIGTPSVSETRIVPPIQTPLTTERPVPTSGSATPERSGLQSLITEETIFNGGNDALIVSSLGITFDKRFRIEAGISLDREFPLSFGDTLVSKGNGFALYPISPACRGNVGMLIDGKDDCTDVKLKAKTDYKLAVEYNNNTLVYILDGKEIRKVTINGPLEVSRDDVIIGRRPSLTNRFPIAGTVIGPIIYDNGGLVVVMSGRKDVSPEKRLITPQGDPKTRSRTP